MLPVQILLILFALVAALKVFNRMRKEELSQTSAALWIVFWLLSAGVALKPEVTFSVAKLFGVGRGADVIVYFSLAMIFFLIFRIMVRQEKISREITKLVRNETLKNDK